MVPGLQVRTTGPTSLPRCTGPATKLTGAGPPPCMRCRQLTAGGMFRNNTLNMYMEKSIVTGVGNCITSYDRLNFQPSYNVSKPSICD
uniref:Uncharacterized protein n=1 Tax=Rousettus aegyptiacus TaxID=9407 RepID=A0A7J8IFK9_ROUAE|nr:hypothetical protein HJG63_001935 [Rousettus aegyptiacus]